MPILKSAKLRYSLSRDERTAFEFAVMVGELADKAVSGQADWVRNNDRVKAPDMAARWGRSYAAERFSPGGWPG